jgi:hypothetical protein
MKRSLVIVMTASRDWLRGPVNLHCPTCAGLAATVEGQRVPWCEWCQSWLCSVSCARAHACPQRRAVHALLDRLVAA